jgi:hypothetical protein
MQPRENACTNVWKDCTSNNMKLPLANDISTTKVLLAVDNALQV